MQPANSHCYFFEEDAFLPTGRDGFRRRVIKGERLELWFWRIVGGAQGSVIHHHPVNEQLGMVVRGHLDFRIGDRDGEQRVVLGPGEAYLAREGVWHGDSTFVGDDEFGEVWILDVFAPPRKDTDNV
jgi:mannose-6-phosphate isomerase-like protein (cupin superfamily)